MIADTDDSVRTVTIAELRERMRAELAAARRAAHAVVDAKFEMIEVEQLLQFEMIERHVEGDPVH